MGASNNHNRDDTGAGLARIEVGADGLLDGEMAALIAAKSNQGRSSVLQEGHKRDLDGRSIVSDGDTKLHNTDQTANGGEAVGNSAADKDVSAAREDHDQTEHQQDGKEAFHRSPPREAGQKSTPQADSLLSLPGKNLSSAQGGGRRHDFPPPAGFPARVRDVPFQFSRSKGQCVPRGTHGPKSPQSSAAVCPKADHSWWPRSGSHAQFRIGSLTTVGPPVGEARLHRPGPHTEPGRDVLSSRDR